MMRAAIALTLLLFLRVTASAQSAWVLVPITSAATPGAHGSLWVFELSVHNSSDMPLSVTPLAVTDTQVPPHWTTDLPVFTQPPGNPPGQFLRMATLDAEYLHFHLRIRDVSRQADTWGTEVPVVRPEEFRSAIYLNDIPTDGRFRSTVRLYGAAGIVAASARLTFTNRGQRLLTMTVPLLATSVDGRRPAYAQLPMESLPELLSAERVTLAIESENGDPIWGFVSVTNNATQHVTTITPD